ncbi:helix-turn-helix domain-containing protein [Lentisphaerota bacterium WC36G]|nr:winged helix-turn-helix domain-containing protein [Lentisphaerae bacterium WC36]
MLRDYERSGGECYGYFLENECFDCEYAASCKFASDNDVKNEFISIDRVVEMFGYLAKSDETTLKMTLEILRNPNATQSEIARKYGVSRQRIHSAIKEVCTKDERLASLFCLIMKRSTLLNAIDKNYKNETENKNNNQLELF